MLIISYFVIVCDSNQMARFMCMYIYIYIHFYDFFKMIFFKCDKSSCSILQIFKSEINHILLHMIVLLGLVSNNI